jgi:hypothetical protein
MKVICIDDKRQNGEPHPFLKFGYEYEPIGEGINLDGSPCYEIPNQFGVTWCINGQVNARPLYRKSRFIPLSEIDETELIKEREDAYAIQ